LANLKRTHFTKAMTGELIPNLFELNNTLHDEMIEVRHPGARG